MKLPWRKQGKSSYFLIFIYLFFYRLFPKKVDLQALMKYYDIDGDGSISYNEFIRGLREPLNERRQKIVDKVYGLLDLDGGGKITIPEIGK